MSELASGKRMYLCMYDVCMYVRLYVCMYVLFHGNRPTYVISPLPVVTSI